MTISSLHLDQLRAIVGRTGFLDQPADIAPFTVDHRHLYHGATPLVLRPDSTVQVSAILRLCHEHHIGVVPVGGNTSYCGGATPDEDGSQIVVSMARMRRIRAVDPLNFAITAEAGCVLAEIQAAATAADRLFPLSLGSEGSCQLGGNLSTNAGGTAVLRYGMMRDLVLGLEVVLPDGRILNGLQSLRKDNTGYDLDDLFIGAEGTLGIITAASCKLFSQPVTRVTAFVAVGDPQAAVNLLSRLRSATGDGVVTFELIPRLALDLVVRHIDSTRDPLDRIYAWYVLVEVSGGRDSMLRDALESELASAMDANEVLNAVIAESDAQRESLWRLRETIPEAQRREGASIKHDISITTSDLPRFMLEGTAAVLDICPRARMVTYGHLGDGNLHFNVSPPEGMPGDAFLLLAWQINRTVHDLIEKFSGSISAEHGIGKLKRDELIRYKDPVAMQLMRSIKQAIDPHGIMNRGKVV